MCFLTQKQTQYRTKAKHNRHKEININQGLKQLPSIIYQKMSSTTIHDYQVHFSKLNKAYTENVQYATQHTPFIVKLPNTNAAPLSITLDKTFVTLLVHWLKEYIDLLKHAHQTYALSSMQKISILLVENVAVAIIRHLLKCCFILNYLILYL